MDWCLYGDDKRKEMDRDLKPEYLLDDLRRYQDVFGEEFGVKELLMLEDIRVKAMIAGALADMPEFLIDQIGKANNSSTLMGTAGGTFLSIVPNLSSDDIAKTVILATVGAVVSFTISLLLKSLNKKHKK